MADELHRAEQRWLGEALGLSGGDGPFPWQEELLRRFVRGCIPDALDIPTGLGKTAVMAIALGREPTPAEIHFLGRAEPGVIIA